MKKAPIIIIIGDGSIGGIVAALLQKSGYDVSIIAKNDARAKQLSEQGIEVTGVSGHITSKIPALGDITQLKRRPDYIFITTKAPDMPEVAKKIKPLLPDDCLVVSFQNGIVEEELAKIVGKDRTVGCVVGWGATRHPEGIFEMTSKGEFVIGYIHKPVDEQLNELAKILNHILPVETSDSILNHLYSKLIINACITTVGAICGLMMGKMLMQKTYRYLYLAIIREAIQVSDAMQLSVPKYAGKLDYYDLLKWSPARQHLFLMAFGFKYRRLKSSSLQSLERGRKTEVNYFNGYISVKGKVYGVPTPVNDLCVDLVRDIEEGKRKISVENIKEFALH